MIEQEEVLEALLLEKLHIWSSHRDERTDFWGEDHDTASIEGWSEALPTLIKIRLVNEQISSDIDMITGYELWEADR